MPNHVRNRVVVRGSAKEIDQFLKEVGDEESKFSFNKIIPMPRTMNIQSGSTADDCLLYVITDTFSDLSNPQVADIPLHYIRNLDPCSIQKLLDQEAFKKRVQSCMQRIDTLSDVKSEGEPEYLFDAASSPRTKQDAIFLGKTMQRNIQEYSTKDWYDWSCKNWGTKWPAYEISVSRADDCTIEMDFQTAWSMPEPIIVEIISKFPNLYFEGVFADEDIGSNCGKWVGKSGTYILVDQLQEEAVCFACKVWDLDPEDFK